MGWLRVTIEVIEPEVAAAEAALLAHGAVSVTLSDAGDAPVVEPDPGTTPVWPQSRVEALFDPGLDLTALRAELGDNGLTVDFLEDRDWQAAWRAHAVHACFGGRLWIVARDAEAPDGAVLRLEPGLAFGSGSHPTTRLCLDWLASRDLADWQVLDYGCGSGVLALAALTLGARRAVAIDHDPQALLATRENAAYNGLADDRLLVAAPAELADKEFDLVVANILANPLVTLANRLAGAARPGATLLLSGVLADQCKVVMDAYAEVDFQTPEIEMDDQGARWARLVGTVR